MEWKGNMYKLYKTKRRIYSALGIVFLIFFSARVAHAVSLGPLELFPSSLYTDDDVKVVFSVKVEGLPDPNFSLTLAEVDQSGEKIRFTWPLTDDGNNGDDQAHDGIYSRKVQFKEGRPKTLSFLVTTDPPEGLKTFGKLPEVSPSQKATLEFKPRPSMIEVLGQIFRKLIHSKDPKN